MDGHSVPLTRPAFDPPFALSVSKGESSDHETYRKSREPFMLRKAQYERRSCRFASCIQSRTDGMMPSDQHGDREMSKDITDR